MAPNVKYSNGEAQYPEVTKWNDTTKQLDTVYPHRPCRAAAAAKSPMTLRIRPHLATPCTNSTTNSPSASALMFRSAQAPNTTMIRCCAIPSTNWGCKRWRFSPPWPINLNDRHSFAVGLIAQHTTAELRQYANFGPAVAGSSRKTGSQIATGLTQFAAASSRFRAALLLTEAAGGDTTALQAQLTALQTQQATHCTASRRGWRIGQRHRQQPRW